MQKQRSGDRFVDQLRSTTSPSENQFRSPAQPRRGREEAFTRFELTASLGALALLVALALPLLASNRVGSDRAVCQSNLRQIGQAFRMWTDDHGGNYPFLISRDGGGNNDIALCNNAWFQYYWLSNEIRTPRILACPSDEEKRVVDGWTDFVAANARDTTCSYVIALGIRQSPHGILSADRNIRPTSRNSGGCAAGPLYAGTPSLSYLSPTLDWLARLHQYSGNILLNDGSVVSAGRKELVQAVQHASSPEASLCVLYPLPVP